MAKKKGSPEYIKKRLAELKKKGNLGGLEREADKVNGLLLSPDNLHLAQEALEELEEKIRMREQVHQDKLAPYKHKMEIWKKQGFDTTGLAEVMAQEHRDPETLDKVFWRFEKMVERVVNMEKDLFAISIPEFEVEIEGLREIMTDPKRLGEVARRYHHLVENINTLKREKRRRQELKATVEKYKDMGYEVRSLTQAFEEDLKSLEVKVSELEDSVIILQDLEETLNGMDSTGIEDRINYIRKLLYNPEKLHEAIDAIEALETIQ